MKNEFISYKEALALKELGFNEPCVGTYHNRGNGVGFTFGMFQHPKRNSQANTVSGTFIGEQGCYAPLYQQAFRWFREEHGLYVEYYILEYRGQDTYAFQIFDFKKQSTVYNCCLNDDGELIKGGYSTHSGAEEASLKKIINKLKFEKIKENKNE